MSLFRSSIPPPAPISDEAIRRYVDAIRADLEPDPLFRRRLRGHVLNRFVAARQELSPRGAAKEMGRLGRAVLVASFALSLSVTGAMAASQQVIPGDALYPLKRQVEDLRVRIVPDRLHDELAAYALGQRIAELHRLAEIGNWTAVAAHAEAVEAAYDAVVALSPDAGSLAQHLEVASSLLDRLPDQARGAVARAMGDDRGVGTDGAPGIGPSSPGDGQRDAVSGSGGSSGGQQPQPGPRPPPQPSAEPEATPRAHPRHTPTPKPTRTPKPTPVSSPETTATPQVDQLEADPPEDLSESQPDE